MVLHGFNDGAVILTMLPPPLLVEDGDSLAAKRTSTKVLWLANNAYEGGVCQLSHINHASGALALSGGKDASFCITRLVTGKPVRMVQLGSSVRSLITSSAKNWAGTSNASGQAVGRRDLASSSGGLDGQVVTMLKKREDKGEILIVCTPAEGAGAGVLAKLYTGFYLPIGVVVEKDVGLGNEDEDEDVSNGGLLSAVRKNFTGVKTYAAVDEFQEENAAVIGFAQAFILVLITFMKIAGGFGWYGFETQRCTTQHKASYLAIVLNRYCTILVLVLHHYTNWYFTLLPLQDLPSREWPHLQK